MVGKHAPTACIFAIPASTPSRCCVTDDKTGIRCPSPSYADCEMVWLGGNTIAGGVCKEHFQAVHNGMAQKGTEVKVSVNGVMT